MDSPIPVMRFKPDIIAQACEMKVEDLNKPQSAVIYPLYRGFVEAIIPRDMLQTTSIDAQLHLSNPSFFDEAIPEVIFLKKLSWMMERVGISDFSPMDILEPEAGRTKQNLSCLIHLNDFRLDWKTKFQDMKNQVDDTAQNLHGLEMEVQDRQTELRALKSKREMEEPVVNQLKGECEILEKEIFKLNQQQAQLREESNTIKEQIKEIKQKIDSANSTKAGLLQEIAKFKGGIIQSPEKFKRTIHDLKVSLESEKTACEDAVQKSQRLEAKFESLIRLEKELSKTLEQLEDLKLQLEKRKKAKTLFKENKKLMASYENELRSLKTQEQQSVRTFKQSENKVKEMVDRLKMKVDSADYQVKEAQKEKLEAEKEKHLMLAKFDQNQLAGEQWNFKIDSLKREHDLNCQKMKDMYESLESQVEDYNRRLFDAMTTSL